MTYKIAVYRLGAALSFALAVYALAVYAWLPVGSVVEAVMRESFAAHATAVYVHAFSAAIALLLGPLQFAAGLRQRHPALHRWSGRVYLCVGALVGGLSGLYLAQFAFGGAIARLGFSVLALLWLATGVRAFLAIRARDIAAHRRWMIRNFALTFAAVTLRLYLPLAMLAGAEFAQAYPVIAWLCWVPNLLIAERYWNRSGSTRAAEG